MATARVRRRDIIYQRPRQRLTVIEKPAAGKKAKERKKRIFFMFAVLGSLLILNLTEHALIAQNSFSIQKTMDSIEEEIMNAERLKLSINALENPTRIRAIAINKLGMCEPESVTFLSLSALKSGANAREGSELAGLGMTSVTGKNRAR